MRRIALVALSALLVLAVACSGTKSTPSAKATTTSTVAATTPAQAATVTKTPPPPLGQEPFTATAQPTDTPIQPAPTQPPQAASGVTFTSVVGGPPGGTASATVQTSPNASCSITYVTPHGTVSRARGLYAKTAGTTGLVSWSWVIGTSTQPGTGTVTVTCNGVSANAPITIG